MPSPLNRRLPFHVLCAAPFSRQPLFRRDALAVRSAPLRPVRADFRDGDSHPLGQWRQTEYSDEKRAHCEKSAAYETRVHRKGAESAEETQRVHRGGAESAEETQRIHRGGAESVEETQREYRKGLSVLLCETSTFSTPTP